jgi:Cupredoxin-like domain
VGEGVAVSARVSRARCSARAALLGQRAPIANAVRVRYNPRMRRLLPCCLALCLFACKPSAPPPPAGPLPERLVAIRADNDGFTPARIEAKPGEPLLLRFTRTVEVTCADQVVIGKDPVKHALPLNQPVDLKVVAPPSGTLAFACGMHMYKGAIVVQ